MAAVVTLMGAGGKMGCRITDMIADDPAYDVRHVEPSPDGRERLAERGVEPMSKEDALPGSDAVVMAVPDELMGEICDEVVPALDPGTLVILLDPAAAYAGRLPEREDVAYFITHPCHPPLFEDEMVPEADADWFGGQGMAEQHVVCALHRGSESDYDRGEAIARDVYAPVDRAHRVTTEQMAMLEPALSETLAATCIAVIREGMDEAVDRGVPEQAARDFLMGHVRIDLAILFDYADFPFSDGALQAMEEAKAELFDVDWDELYDSERVRESCEEISTPE